MATLLHINVSPRGAYSISRQLGNAAVEAWKKKNAGGRIIERDLSKTPLTFVNLDWIAGAYTPAEHHNENHKKALAMSDQLISEIVEADEIILATPMYNFANALFASSMAGSPGFSRFFCAARASLSRAIASWTRPASP